MHIGTHLDAPAHVLQGGAHTDELPLENFYGTGVVVDIPKKKWGTITPEDLENATPRIEKGDFVVISVFPLRWYQGDGSMVRMVALIDKDEITRRCGPANTGTIRSDRGWGGRKLKGKRGPKLVGSIESMFSLTGKVALLTGATRGMGEEIAAVYRKAGARVAVCSRSPAGVEEAVARLAGDEHSVFGTAADVLLPEDRKRLVEAVMDWAGRIDILVNNAGMGGSGFLADLTEEAWDKTFDLNVKAALFVSQLVYNSWMKAHGGVIINMASVGGFVVTNGISAYNVSKAALVHLTRSMASEWGHDGVRVNALAPGLIKTKFSRRLWDDPQYAAIVGKHPLPRFGEVEDIGGAALLLASDASSFMTGHALVIDGGQLISFAG